MVGRELAAYQDRRSRLEADGVRLVHVEGEWTCPVGGAHKHLKVHDAVNESRKSLVPFDEQRAIATVHQPVVR